MVSMYLAVGFIRLAVSVMFVFSFIPGCQFACATEWNWSCWQDSPLKV